MTYEIVCPQFYVEEWEAAGRHFSESLSAEFGKAADDGVCRMMKTVRDEFGDMLFVCRCGIKFKAADGKQVELR